MGCAVKSLRMFEPPGIATQNGSSPHPKNEGRYGLAGGLNFFRSIVTFPRGWRPEIALRRPLEFPTVPSEGISMSGENSYLSRLASNQ